MTTQLTLKEQLAAKKKAKEAADSGQPRVGSISELLGGGGEADVSILVSKAKEEGRFVTLTSDKFVPDPDQPRKTFTPDSIAWLRESIETMGQLQPIIVRPADQNGFHMIIAGERRWRAIQASESVHYVDAVIVTSDLDELLVLKMQIHENDNREGVNALESSAAIVRGVELCKARDQTIDDKQAAIVLGISRSAISKARAIHGAPDEVKALSSDNVMQDPETLYEITKAFKRDPETTNQFIADLRANDIGGNVRRAAQQLDSSLKVAKGASEHPKPSSKQKTKPSSNKKEDDIPVADRVSFGEEAGEVILSMSVGKQTYTYKLSEKALKALKKKFS